MYKKIILLAMCLVLFIGIGGANGPFPCGGGAGDCSCGYIVIGNVNLTEDLDCSVVGGGLTVGADDITIDCGNHSIIGDGVSIGTDIDDYWGVTIQNCDISQFSTGIYAEYGKGLVIQNNNITDGTGYGIEIYSSSGSQILNNNVSNNAYSGIFIYGGGGGASDHVIKGNTVTENSQGGCDNNCDGEYCGAGIRLDYEYNCTIQNNTVSDNGYNGISLYYSRNNQIINNTVEGNNHLGIRLSGGAYASCTGCSSCYPGCMEEVLEEICEGDFECAEELCMLYDGCNCDSGCILGFGLEACDCDAECLGSALEGECDYDVDRALDYCGCPDDSVECAGDVCMLDGGCNCVELGLDCLWEYGLWECGCDAMCLDFALYSEEVCGYGDLDCALDFCYCPDDSVECAAYLCMLDGWCDTLCDTGCINSALEECDGNKTCALKFCAGVDAANLCSSGGYCCDADLESYPCSGGCVNNIVSGNILVNNGDVGIRVAQSGNSITNNTIIGDGSFEGWKWGDNYGIYVYSNNVDPEYNYFSGNEISGYYYGIYLDSSDYNDITNNTANSNGEYGIYLYSSSNNDLIDNTANDNYYGILIDDSSDYNSLINNTANSNVEGIYIYGSSYNTVDGNTVNDNDCTGIAVEAGCFLGGTKILLADSSYKNIEDVEVGDLVQSYDEDKKGIVTGKVLKTFYHERTDYYLVVNDKLRLTPNHPMYVNNEWKEAGDIKIGDLLLDKDGNNVPVTSVEKIDESVPVYNLEVSGYHNYFAEDILTHNKCPRIFSYNGTAYPFDVLINVWYVGPEEDWLFEYPLKYLKEPKIRVEYDPKEINYIDFIKLIIEDTAEQEELQDKTYLLNPISCSGTDFDCDLSLLEERDSQYLISDVDHKEFFLEFEDFPELEPGYSRTIKIFSSGYQTIVDGAEFGCECEQVEGVCEFLDEYFSENNQNPYDNRYNHKNSYNTVSNNNVSGNGFVDSCCGIGFIWEDNSDITTNTVNENYMGICLEYSYEIIIQGNTIKNNTGEGMGGCGIDIYESNAMITQNTICYNIPYGVHVMGESGATVTDNTFCVDPISPADGTWTTNQTPTYDFTFSASNILLSEAFDDATETSCTLYIDDDMRGGNSSIDDNTSTTLPSVTLSGYGTHDWNVTCSDSDNNAGTSKPMTITCIEAIAEEIKTTDPINAGEEGTVTFNQTDLIEIKINVTNNVSGVEVTVQELNESHAEYGIAGATAASEVMYSYFSIDTNITDANITDVTIGFRVERSWIAANGIDENKVALKRYNDTTKDWDELSTTKVAPFDDGTYVYYEATSPGLSAFAVIGGMPTPSGGGGRMTTSVSQRWRKLTPEKVGTMRISNKNICVSEISIKVKTDVSDPQITVQKLSQKPAAIPQEPSGKVYRYIEISAENIADDDVDSLTIKFEVKKTWTGDGVIVLSRWHNNTWNSLSTQKIDEDSAYTYYEAASPGLSTFVIAAVPIEVTPAAAPVTEGVPVEEEVVVAATPTAEEAVTATPTAVPIVATATPTPSATSTPVAISTPAPTPAEEKGIPGFEIAFAIAGLLAITYLVGRRRNR